MSFRERPEYQEWRDAVFGLFGRQCILCGHGGNLHAHHVRPVNTYPELAFDPKNGAPLCGNCHAEVNGNESSHAEEIERRQRAILGGQPIGANCDGPSETELRERAGADPSDTEAVERWFCAATDEHAVVEFYNQHRRSFRKTVTILERLGFCLYRLTRWRDVVKVADAAIQTADREGTLERHAESFATLKSQALNKLGMAAEAVDFSRKLVARFPGAAWLHRALSVGLHALYVQERDGDDLVIRNRHDGGCVEESFRHAIEAARLAPDAYVIVDWAAFVSRVNGDNASAFRYGKQALAIAKTAGERISALRGLADTCESADLYSDARGYLREALQIDDCNVGTIADLAHCYYMEGNTQESLRTAKRGLLLDPNDERCLGLCSRSGGRG